MPDTTLVSILSFLNTYGYAVIFPISIIEGPIVAVLAGILVATGQMNAAIVFLILLAGDVVGDAGYYLLGRYGGHPFVRRWGHRFGITDSKLESAEAHFAEHDWKILLLGKLQMSPIPTGLATLIAAGMMRMPFWRYLFYNVVGTIPRLIVFEGVGIVFGVSFLSMNKGVFDTITIASLAITALVLVYFFVFRKKGPPKDL